MLTPTSILRPHFRIISDEAIDETALEDASLDLSAYYQTLENLASWLRAHDGLEFDDLAACLEAAGYSLENLTLSLEAFAQSLEDLGLDLSTWATWRDDLTQWLAAYLQSLDDDLPLDLSTWATAYENFKTALETWATGYMNLTLSASAYGQDLTDQPTPLEAAGYYRQDLSAYLAAASSTVLLTLATYLAATDGSTLIDMGLRLIARRSTPSFQALVAQRLSSVMSEAA